MSFTGDYYAPKKAQSKAKRAFNRAASEKNANQGWRAIHDPLHAALRHHKRQRA